MRRGTTRFSRYRKRNPFSTFAAHTSAISCVHGCCCNVLILCWRCSSRVNHAAVETSCSTIFRLCLIDGEGQPLPHLGLFLFSLIQVRNFFKFALCSNH